MSQILYTPAVITKLRAALAHTDRVAYDNVTHDNKENSIVTGDGQPIPGKNSRGGPFGAKIVLVLPDGTVEQIGEARGNNVIGSGIASRHGEDQALQPDNVELLFTRLQQLKDQCISPDVWLETSAQPCNNCYTKLDILSRELEDRDLAVPGQLKVLYGNNFDATLKAQFYDAQYSAAMFMQARDPGNGNNLIRHETLDLYDVPEEVQEKLTTATEMTAVVFRNGKIYAEGQDQRTKFNLYSTAEVSAVQAACLERRKEGEFQSWKVNGILFTTSMEIGPLLFAEAGWTKIDKIVSVVMPPRYADKQFQSREAPGIGNREFLETIAHGYNDPRISVAVFCDDTFKDTAQTMWSEILKVNSLQLYNGADVSPAVEQLCAYTNQFFKAPDLSTVNTDARDPREIFSRAKPVVLAKLIA